MHVVADGYDPTDEKDKVIRRAFFENLTRLLPCPECRAHYDTLLKTNPVGVNMTTRNTLVAWVEWVQAEVEKKIFAQKQQDTDKSETLDIPDVSAAYAVVEAPKAVDESTIINESSVQKTSGPIPQFHSTPRAMTPKERFELCLKKFVRPASCGCR